MGERIMVDALSVFFAVFLAEMCKELASPFIQRWIRPFVKSTIDARLERIENAIKEVKRP